MHRIALGLLVLALAGTGSAPADQTRSQRRGPARRPAPALRTEPAAPKCPAVLGRGVRTKLDFCDVLTGRSPAEGVVITLPRHSGPATLSFNLHNRHTYSEEQTRAGRAYAAYTAIVAVVSPAGAVLARVAVRNEFRSAADLYDRIEGGAGPKGVKAVAPLGAERVSVEVPADVGEVALVGERLEVQRLDGRETHVLPGTPIAAISDVRIEYRPLRTSRTSR
ncbi:MAG TPA: hypothetical protein VNI83_06630 [Vicinamibacterales bacterium]|nr:hypothetical protein [Vicinamibacterales bacterium]